MALLSILFVTPAEAKKKPQIQFEQTTIDLGTFSDPTQVHKVVFKFKNVGKAKLVINYVNTSCGCTVAEYPKVKASPCSPIAARTRQDCLLRVRWLHLSRRSRLYGIVYICIS